MKKVLTDMFIRKAKPAAQNLDVTDMDQLDCKGVLRQGFFIRISPKGRKNWYGRFPTPEGYWTRRIGSYPYILLGGLVAKDRNKVKRDLDRIFESHLTDSSGQVRCKLHGFGLTQLDMMIRYPWHSVDSTSWVNTAAYGSCVFYRSGKLQQVLFSKDSPHSSDNKHYDQMSQAEQQEILKLLEPTGITHDEVREDYNGRRVVNLYTYQQIEKYVHSTHFHSDQP
jgi:hypothetical protein